jgi:L-lactate dehydrogenase complex protein LldG
MTTARDDILRKVRSQQWDGPERPDLAQNWTRYADPRKQFAEVLAAVGGRCFSVSSAAQAQADLDQFEPYATANRIVSLVPGIGRTNFDLAAVSDPHDLEDVDFAILPGDLAVAENAAVWVTDESVRHRVLYFIPQHVALVVRASRLVSNMHEAASRIDLAARAFGCWISGPSKTADIEQALVIGAHGARSMTVYLLGDAALPA